MDITDTIIKSLLLGLNRKIKLYSNKMFKKIKIFIAPTITLLALYIIFKKLDIFSVLDIVKNGNKFVLVFSTIIALVFITMFLAYRLKETMAILGCNLRFKDILKIYLAILPASKLSPANTGDFMRSYYFKDKVLPSVTAGGVFFERIIDILIISLMAMISGALLWLKLPFLLGTAGIMITLIFFFLLKKGLFIKNNGIGRKGKIAEKFFNISVVFNASLKNKYATFKILICTALSWLTAMLYIKSIFYALGSNVSLLHITAFQPVVSYTSLIPTISGVGVRESAMLFFYGNIAPGPIILSAGLIFSFFNIALLPLTGLPLMHKIIKNGVRQNEQ